MVKATDRGCRAQCAWKRQKLRVFVMLLCRCLPLSAQSGSDAVPSAEQVRQFAAEQRWEDIALLLGPLQSRSADLNFYYGTALARLEHWREAESAFQAGLRLAPHDPRFPIELAGVAFKQKHYPHATRLLRQALKLAPQDAYTNDFLGTIYFLQENLDASLKYWNRVAKPEVVELRVDPLPQVSPALLDRAFAFSPASTLHWREVPATEPPKRVLGIFPRFQCDLPLRGSDNFRR